MTKPYKIMFVCLGNICRSPMAELVMKDLARKQGRENDFIIESSATSDENVYNGVGARVYPPIRELLEKKGISTDGKRAQVLEKAHGDRFDLFLCMDDNNVRNARRILGEKHADKCKKLLSFAGENASVADPWYTRDFEKAYDDVYRGVTALLDSLE